MKHSKACKTAADKRDGSRLRTPEAAMKLVKEMASAKFDETIEVAMCLGANPRKVDQMVRSTVNLPNDTGKTARVLIFVSDEKAKAVIVAGADEVGTDDLVEKISGGYLDFDTIVAAPDMMSRIGRLDHILGPCGLMPNPKTDTVTVDMAKAVSGIKGGKIKSRVDRHANLQPIVGKASSTEQQLVENYFTALEEILRLRPTVSKGRYVKKVVFSATMSPSVLVDGAATKPVE